MKDNILFWAISDPPPLSPCHYVIFWHTTPYDEAIYVQDIRENDWDTLRLEQIMFNMNAPSWFWFLVFWSKSSPRSQE